MKKLTMALSLLSLLFLICGLAAQDKADAKILKEKMDQKVTQMKATGASAEEVKRFIADFQKKVATMNAEEAVKSPNQEIFMAKVDKMTKEMKAVGASDEQIKKLVTDVKKKWAESQDGKVAKPDRR
jgi:DNA-binding transcriptional regulator YhcF (GntR family)